MDLTLVLLSVLLVLLMEWAQHHPFLMAVLMEWVTLDLVLLVLEALEDGVHGAAERDG